MTSTDAIDLLKRIRAFARAVHSFPECSDKVMRAALEDIDLIISRRIPETEKEAPR